MVVDTTKSKALEVFFNALYQEPLPAFQKAYENGVGIIVKVPLDSGWLSGRYRKGHNSTISANAGRRKWLHAAVSWWSNSPSSFPKGLPWHMPRCNSSWRSRRFRRSSPVQRAWNRHWITLPQQRTASPGGRSIHDELWEREIKSDPLPW